MTPDIKGEGLPTVFDYTKDQCFFMFKKSSGSGIHTIPKNYRLTSVNYVRGWFNNGRTELKFMDEKAYPSTLARTFQGVSLSEHNSFCEQLQQHYYDTAFVNKL